MLRRPRPAPSPAPPLRAVEGGGLRSAVIAPRRGWGGPAAGRAAYLPAGSVYLATSVQAAGLFPFMQSSGLPPEGVPIGPDLLTHEMVCLDPPGSVGRLTTNPNIWVQGQPGAGKSAMAKRLCLGLVGFGYGLLCPGDVKGEYTGLVRALGGQVLRIGRGLDTLNPLDSGPLGRRLHCLAGAERDQLAAEVNGRRAELVAALLATSYGLNRRPAAAEATALNTAIRLAAAATPGTDPTIPDVLRLLRDPPAELLDRLMVRTDEEYLSEARPVVARWFEHGEGVARLHACWMAWQELTDPAAGGHTGPSVWHRDHLADALQHLMHPEGPFSGCSADPAHPSHDLPRTVLVTSCDNDDGIDDEREDS